MDEIEQQLAIVYGVAAVMVIVFRFTTMWLDGTPKWLAAISSACNVIALIAMLVSFFLFLSCKIFDKMLLNVTSVESLCKAHPVECERVVDFARMTLITLIAMLIYFLKYFCQLCSFGFPAELLHKFVDNASNTSF